MRFRLDAGNGAGDQLEGGLGNLVRSFAMMPQMKEQWAQEAGNRQAKQDYERAKTDNMRSQTNLHKAQSDDIRQQQDRGTLDQVLRNSALTNGVPMSAMDDYVNYAKTGAMPTQFVMPDTNFGDQDLPAPSYYGKSTLDKVLQMTGLTNNAMAMGDKNATNVTKAQGQMIDNDAVSQALDAIGLKDYMKSSAIGALRGNREFTPFKSVGTTGTALNEVTGQQPVTNEIMNVLFKNEGKALIGQRNAAAGASGAATGASNALRALRVVQANNARIDGGMSALDYDAAQRGEVLPSTNKAGRAADSTNAKFRNTVIASAMKNPAFAIMSAEEKTQAINQDLMAVGMDPVVPGDLASISPRTASATPAKVGINANAGDAASLPKGYTKEKALSEAKAAIANGKDRDAVTKRLKDMGINAEGL